MNAHASGNGRPTLANRLFVALQYLLPQHFLSSQVFRITRSRSPAVKDFLIRNFVRSFHPDMSDALQPDPLAYPSFNEFFTRALRPGAREIEADSRTLVSPVDGTISQIGRLDGSQLLQAKGLRYSLPALLSCAATAVDWPARFSGGHFATIYLAPFNYHRIHMPLSGTLVAAWYVPGRLFSVNTTTAAAVPGLFARNERVVCIFTAADRLFAMILVGALFVGSMDTVWHGQITPRRPRKADNLPLDASRAPLTQQKGAEMGRFNMGSTVIVLTPPGLIEWSPEIEAGQPLRMGQPLARLMDNPQ